MAPPTQPVTRPTKTDLQQACPEPTLQTRPVVVHQGRTPETENEGMKGGRGGGGGGGRGIKGDVGVEKGEP